MVMASRADAVGKRTELRIQALETGEACSGTLNVET